MDLHLFDDVLAPFQVSDLRSDIARWARSASRCSIGNGVRGSGTPGMGCEIVDCQLAQRLFFLTLRDRIPNAKI